MQDYDGVFPEFLKSKLKVQWRVSVRGSVISTSRQRVAAPRLSRERMLNFSLSNIVNLFMRDYRWMMEIFRVFEIEVEGEFRFGGAWFLDGRSTRIDNRFSPFSASSRFFTSRLFLSLSLSLSEEIGRRGFTPASVHVLPVSRLWCVQPCFVDFSVENFSRSRNK